MTSANPELVEASLRKINEFERSASGMSGRTPKNTLFQPNGAAAMQTTTENIETPRRIPIAAEAGPSSLLDIILRAGSDPSFDVEKFERLVQIQRDEQDRQDKRAEHEAVLEAESAFNAAMTAVQAQMPRIAPDSQNKSTNSNYASYAAADRALRSLYTGAGFALSFNEEDSPKPDHVRVVCYVTHTAPGVKRSHTRPYHADMPNDGKGARGGDVMSKTHATGSAFTYGQRYVVKMIFNVAVGKDDDGNLANTAALPAPIAPGCISAPQADELRKMLDDRRISHRAFLQLIQLARVEDIGVEHFERAKAKIKGFGSKS